MFTWADSEDAVAIGYRILECFHFIDFLARTNIALRE